jgi:ribosome-interacting GTPase 1
MPANLTPDYHRAEQRFREARTAGEKIAALEDMLRVMPKHKGTDHLQADLRSRLAKLRREPQKKGARGGFSYIIPSEGAGQVAVVGPPNSGKSSLVAALTRARPEVGEYAFTTREPTPGMMPFEDVAFQLIDLPPVSVQHVDPWVFDLVRHADLVWLTLSATDALEGFDEVRRLLDARSIGLAPAGRPPDDVPAAARVDRRALMVLTGSDLKRRTFAAMEIVRVYTKQPGRPRERTPPFTLPRGATVADLALRIHHDVLAAMKFARIWGASAFDGQAVQKDHVLAEGDVVEIHT